MSDIDIIRQIEKTLGIKFEAKSDSTSDHSYSLGTDGRVVSLSLSGDRWSKRRFEVLPAIPLIKELTGLRELILLDTDLTNISALSELTNLTKLGFKGNQLHDISPLVNLTNLSELNLGNNRISDIASLKNLKNLRSLYLHENQVSDITAIKDLQEIETLYLWGNQIKDISPLKDLKNLKCVTLQLNPIEGLPPWITDFGLEIVWNGGGEEGNIHFEQNPLKSPPPEIVKQGNEAIRNYFKQLDEQNQDYLFEAKLLIVGEPGAGKSSMAWKMENPLCALPKEEDTTKGIDVRQYYFPLRQEDFSAVGRAARIENRQFRLNLWDFGGQEIYKATHRFFLSKRSLYALVADSRNEDTDFNYWLHIVEMFGGDSPLLIVLNEKHQRKRNLDIAAMRKRFTNISEVIDVDFAEEDKTRLNKLERAVRYFVSKLPHVGSPVPAKWALVREAVERDARNTITLQDYLAICAGNGITKHADALVLSQYFHDIGVFLHFQDDDLLKKTIFLKPNWATNAVYKILDHELLNRQNGRFDREDTKVIWAEEEYDLLREELLRLMQKFFLVYEIERSGEYIVPERLQPVQPEYDWDEDDNLFLRYEYDFFMPKGIMSQLTVRLHRYISDHRRVWRRGVVLRRGGATAEVVETYDARTIKIRIAGADRRDFMTVIAEQLDQINSQYEKMKVEKLIPCNCAECKTDGSPYFYKHRDLKRRLEKGRQTVECGKSYLMVDVRGLIDEVINERLRGRGEEGEVAGRRGPRAGRVRRDKIFISYSHKDKAWLKKVQTNLKVLGNLGISVDVWDDTRIKPGMKWHDEIKKALAEAKVAVLLVSTDFLASSFISSDELPPLLKAAEDDGAAILPVILKPCLYEEHQKLSEFQAVNDASKPLSKLPVAKRDEILAELAKRISELMSEAG